MGRGISSPIGVTGDAGPRADETTSLLQSAIREESCSRQNHTDEADADIQPSLDGSQKSLHGFLAILLLGVLVSQADSSIVLVTYGQISSEFGDFQSGSWLMTSYMLAQCVAQPLYGKLSDIFGRKSCLEASYIIFAIGTVGSGLAESMFQLIAARAVQGCGSAGIVGVVAILLTDLVPVHEVALYRSYVNVIQTIGRSCGGAIGGYLTQMIGWRWVFLGQSPFILVALFLVYKMLPETAKPPSDSQTIRNKLRRIDIAGAISMSLSIVSALLILDTGGKKFPWNHPIVTGAAVVALTSGIMFVLIETYWAQEPIFPLRLITKRSVVNSYTSIGLQNLTQLALIATVPLYWQVTEKTSPAAAGFYIIPSVTGNTLGGLAAGKWIMRYRRYKLPIVVAAASSMFTFASVIIYWRGNTNPLGSLLVFFGGFGTGIAHSAVFVSLTNDVADEDIAIASSGFFLSASIGGVVGVSATSAVYQAILRRGLLAAFKASTNREEIVRRALQDMRFVQHANERLRKLMLPAYIVSFQAVFYMCLACTALALVSGLLVREKRLRGR